MVSKCIVEELVVSLVCEKLVKVVVEVERWSRERCRWVVRKAKAMRNVDLCRSVCNWEEFEKRAKTMNNERRVGARLDEG